MANPTCQAAVKEAGTEAVEAAMALQLQQKMKTQNHRNQMQVYNHLCNDLP